MARKLNKSERAQMTFARGSQIAVDEAWFDGEVWALESEDFAPHTPEVARQLIRSQAVKRGHKIATKIRDGVLYLQVVAPSTAVVENDAA